MKIEDILNKQENDFKNRDSLLKVASKQGKIETIDREINGFIEEAKTPLKYPDVSVKKINVKDFVSDPLVKKEWKLAEVNAKLFQEISGNKKQLDELFSKLLNENLPVNSDINYLPSMKHFFDFYQKTFEDNNIKKYNKIRQAEISEDISESNFYSKQFDNNPGNGGTPLSIGEQEESYKKKNSEKSFITKVLENIDISFNDKYSKENPENIGINEQINDYEKKVKDAKDESDKAFQTGNVSTSISAGSPLPVTNISSNVAGSSETKKSNYDFTQNMASPKFKGRPGQTESVYSAVYYWLSDLMYYMSGRKPGSQGQQSGDYPGSIIYKENIPLLPSFILWQTTLHGMNPQFGKGQVWSPTDFAAALAPGTLTNTADTGFSADLQGKEKGSFDIPTITQIELDALDPVYGGLPGFGKPKVYSRPLMNYTRGLENTIQKNFAAAILTPSTEPTGYLPENMKEHTLGPSYKNVIFSDNNNHSGIGSRYHQRDTAFKLKSYTRDSTAGSTDIDLGIFEADSNSEGLLKAAIRSETYIPFFFKDLRPNGASNRFLLFRAFIDSISEGFNPSVSTESFFGRTDPIILSDTSVVRTIDLSFKMVALSPNDVDVIYKKLNWLTSMVYCEYDSSGYVRLGPLLQLRVGDLICDDNNNGINGKITSLKYDYGKYLWEVGNKENEFQVPLAIDISLGFTVSHSKPIKVKTGKFETAKLRKVGKIA